MTDTHILTLYLRADCSLCDCVLHELTPYKQRYGFQLDCVDIDSDPELAQKYGEKIPVLHGAGKEIFHFFLDPDALNSYFATL